MGWLLFGNAVINFGRCSLTRNLSSANNTPQIPSPDGPKKTATDFGIRKVTTLSELHKWALVFSGKYKTKAEIPEYVPHEVLERARSRARIKVSNILMGLTLLGCLLYAYSGRQARNRGESVSQMNLDWHKDYAEKVKAEQEQQAKK